ncbi:MAG: methyltransferase domain-containing protein [Chloroflexota bacterium]
MILQDVISRKIPPEPWMDGDKIPWDEPAFSQRMLKEHLSQAHDAASRRFTTIDKHVNWIHSTILAQKPSQILDLGCGPGLYTERLARLGHHCVGIDFGPASIEYAQEQATSQNLTIDYRHEDIRQAEYGVGFDLVMLINGEFNVFRPTEARKLLLKSLNALNEGGLLLIEPHTFAGVQIKADEPSRWRAAQKGLFSDFPHLWLQEHFWDAKSDATITRHYIIDATTAEVTKHAETLQAYKEERYRQLLTSVGFSTIQRFASLTGSADFVQDDMFVLVAQKDQHNDTDTKDNARQELERIRRGVRTAPRPEIDDAPEWLNDIEEMRGFFSSAAPVWDKVFGADKKDPLYEAVAEQIAQTESAVRVLVLGCGTGLELPAILAKVPNAHVTGVDSAPGMLAELRKKFPEKMTQIELIEESYVDLPLGDQQFDYVIATLTVHHLAPKAKLALYQNIRAALQTTGKYIEGDQSTSPQSEQENLRWYQAYISTLPGGDKAEWNYDVTLSPETEERLLREAGFAQVDLTWEQRDESGHGLAVFLARSLGL